MWLTNDTHFFIRDDGPLAVGPGSMTLTLQPGTIYSVTTLTTVTHGNVSGAVPEDTAFALPYADSFDGYKNDSYPRYLADQGGSFTVLNDVPGEAAGGVLRQMTPVNSVENSWGLNSDPISLIGDLSWENTAVSVFCKVVTDAVSATSTPAPLQVAPCVPGATEQLWTFDAPCPGYFKKKRRKKRPTSV